MSELAEPLVRVPKCTLYNVEPHSDAVEVAAAGDFVIAYPRADEPLQARVEHVCWPLGRWVATLRFDDHTYSFQLPPSHAPPPGATAAGAATAAATATAAAAGGAGATAARPHYYCLALPADTSLELIDLLQAVLSSASAYHDQANIVPAAPTPTPSPAGSETQQQQQRGAAPAVHGVHGSAVPGGAVPGNADRIAAGLQRGGQMAAAGVLAAAAAMGAAMNRGAEAAVARLAPSERRDGMTPEAHARMERAKSAASRAAEFSGRAVGGALSVTAQAAGAIAQRIASSGLGRSLSNGRVAGASMQDVRKVGVAGVEAAEAVYNSLADAARVVLAHSNCATTRVVGHTYGPAAAQATSGGFAVAQSVAETGLNVYKLRPTALVRKVFKGAATNVALGTNGSGGAAAGAAGGMAVGAVAAGAASGPSVSAYSGISGGGGGVRPGSVAAAPSPHTAAAASLAALTGHHAQPAAAARPAGAPAAAVTAAVSYSAVAEGVVVSGPVPANPVLYHHPAAPYGQQQPQQPYGGVQQTVVDYTPSAAAFYGNGPAANGQLPPGNPQGLPYPAVSAGQYNASYYPAVPRT